MLVVGFCLSCCALIMINDGLESLEAIWVFSAWLSCILVSYCWEQLAFADSLQFQNEHRWITWYPYVAWPMFSQCHLGTSSLSATVCPAGNENTLTMQSPPTSMTPPPSKKRCWAPQGECEDKKTETLLPYPTFTSQQEQGVNKSAFNGIMFDIWYGSEVYQLFNCQ